MDVPPRVGLLTLPLHTNYGGIVQAVAMYRLLSHELGCEVVFLERVAAVGSKSWLKRALIGGTLRLPFLFALRAQLRQAAQGQGWLARVLAPSSAQRAFRKLDRIIRTRRSREHQPFIARAIPRRSGALTSTAQMAAAITRFGLDTLVVGSDQVWRLGYHPPGAEQDFFFGFAPDPGIRKIAYAASFGLGEWTYPEHLRQTQAALGRFHAVGVREASGVQICSERLGRPDAVHVLDPTMVVDPACYAQLAAPPAPRTAPTLMSYVLDDDPQRQAIGDELLQALGRDFRHRALKLDIGWATLDVPGWLRAFMDADFVLTDSFHGVVFSIIFRKNFIAIVNRDRGADRFTSLLGQLGLLERLVAPSERERVGALARQPIDYERVTARLEALRAHSLAFLRAALRPAATTEQAA